MNFPNELKLKISHAVSKTGVGHLCFRLFQAVVPVFDDKGREFLETYEPTRRKSETKNGSSPRFYPAKERRTIIPGPRAGNFAVTSRRS